MDEEEKSTTAVVPSIRCTGIRTGRPSYFRMVENALLFWLDENVDNIKNGGYRDNLTKLQQVVNIVNTFTNVDECIDYITDIKEDKAFVIVSGELSQIIIPILQDISQVICIYIFCESTAHHKQWAKKWTKVHGVYTDFTTICQALKQGDQQCDQNMISISFIEADDGLSNKNLDQLDQSFVYTQILKEILLMIDFDETHINEFLNYYQEQFDSNSIELQNVEKLRKEYQNHQPIWWYTYDNFLYSMLNRALCTMEVDLIIKMGFFVRDLHEDIIALHSQQYSDHDHTNSFTVYRGQALSQTDFDHLMQTQGGLLSFNNFLLTSLDRESSLAIVDTNQYNPDLIGVLFEITINSLISSISFANIRDVSYYQGEEEILFSMHSVFRIGQIKQIEGNNRLWQVNLTLTNDDDPQLHALSKSIEKEITGSTGWLRLGKLMTTLGHFDKAEELYKILLQQTDNEDEKAFLYHHIGFLKDNQGNYEEAIEFYEKSIQINQNTFRLTHPDMIASYHNIGSVYNSMGEYSKALLYYQNALDIWQKTLPPDHPVFAMSYACQGLVYSNMGEYLKALTYNEKALEIWQKTLPPDHPDLAASYNNIGSVYSTMNKYSKALTYYEKALEIWQQTLPPNHPNLATSYNNLGTMYHNIGKYSKALSYSEKALEIYQKTLPSNDPSLATSYNNIGLMYNKMREYSKALLSHEKALEIRQKTLPSHHLDLAQSYNNIGSVYNKMGERSKAILCYERTVDIGQRSLPENHPRLILWKKNLEYRKKKL